MRVQTRNCLLIMALLCAAVRSRNPIISKVATIVRALFMEIPTMVLLMILAYIIFGSSSLPILVIVTVGLTLKAASYLSEIFDTSLSTVAVGEIEAARTLGMSRWDAFRYVALPQTVAAALPLYKNQFIATMQETSSSHMLVLKVEGVESDPLAEPYLDDLNLCLLENYAKFVLSRKSDSGWEICMQM